MRAQGGLIYFTDLEFLLSLGVHPVAYGNTGLWGIADLDASSPQAKSIRKSSRATRRISSSE